MQMYTKNLYSNTSFTVFNAKLITTSRMTDFYRNINAQNILTIRLNK